MKKQIVLYLLAATVFGFSGETVRAVKVVPDIDGTFIQDGEPAVLIGPVLRSFLTYPQLRDYQSKIAPKELDYIYNQVPDAYNMRRAGFSTIGFYVSDWFQQVLGPSYRGYSDPVRGYQDFVNHDMKPEYAEKNQWRIRHPRIPNYYRNVYQQFREFRRDVRMPIYVETSSLAVIFRNFEPYRHLFSGGDAVLNTDIHGTTFAVGLLPHVRAGREAYFKAWKFIAGDYKSCGADVLCYELFNEVKYTDYSPSARNAFVGWLTRRYGTVENLNRAWNAREESFEKIAGFQNVRRSLPLYVDWSKFSEDTLAEFLAEGREAIRSVDPNAKTIVQMHAREMARNLMQNANIYKISEAMDYVNSGTGGSDFEVESPKPEDSPIAENNDISVGTSGNIIAGRLALAVAQPKGKPVINNECYIGTGYDSLFARVWTEFARGRNATYLFEWRGTYYHPSQKKTPQHEAKVAPWTMRNPYAFDPRGMYAIPKVRAELERIADVFLPRRNRARAEIAVLQSYPTVRAENSGLVPKISHEIHTPAMALEYSHYPYDIIFEEQLAERAKQYRVIVAHGVRNVYAGTLPELEKFVRDGGTLLAALEPMAHDEYAKPLKSPLFQGLRLRPAAAKIRRTAYGQSIPYVDIAAAEGWEMVNPAFAVRKYGKGRVAFLSDRTLQYGLMQWYEPLLNQCGIRPMAMLWKWKRDERTGDVEMRKASARGVTCWYMMDATVFPKLVRLRAPELENRIAVEPFDWKKRLPQNGTELLVLLPPRRRTIVLAGTPDVLSRYGSFEQGSPDELQKMFAELEKRSRRVKRIPGRAVDLRLFANKGFDNRQNFPVGIGWFEETRKDLKEIPISGEFLNGVFCDFIRFDYNGNRTCIALKSAKLPDGLTEVKDIPLSGTLRAISFFHAVTHAEPGETVMIYTIHYADGSTLDLPVVVGRNIGSWKIDSNSPEVKKLIAWKNSEGLGFFRWEWSNPEPQKEISSLSIRRINAERDCTPLVVGITVHDTGKQAVRIRQEIPADWKCSAIAEKGCYTLLRNRVRFMAPAGKALSLPPDKLKNARLCFEFNALPDEWGNILPCALLVEGYCLKDEKAVMSMSRMDTLVFLKAEYPSDTDPATWQKAEVPLSMLKCSDSQPLAGFYIQRSDKENCPVQIRNIHFEYEK